MNTQAAILSDVADGVMTITLNRPEAANAVRPDDRDALIALLATADADEKVRVVVLRANGKHFCSGADVGSSPNGARRARNACWSRRGAS